MQKLSIFPGIDEEESQFEIHKTVNERQEVVDEPAVVEEVEVEHVIRNLPVDGPQPIRTEGDTVIVPLVKQVVRVQKEWILTEEVHLTRRRTNVTAHESVDLQEEVLNGPEVKPRRGPLGGRVPAFKGKLDQWN